MNPFLVAMNPVAVRQGKKQLGELAVPAAPPGNPFGVVGGTQGARQVTLVGDEFAGGWGLGSVDETLGARLATRLAEGGPVVWQAVVEPGCTLRQVQQQLSAQLPQQADALAVWVGWSDVIGGTSVKEWRQAMDATVRLLSRIAPLTVVGCPPVDAMPLLRQPLQAVLAGRAKDFDEATARICSEQGASFVSLMRRGDDEFRRTDFQPDGIHLEGSGQGKVARFVASAVA